MTAPTDEPQPEPDDQGDEELTPFQKWERENARRSKVMEESWRQSRL